jgi:hypothetical protein
VLVSIRRSQYKLPLMNTGQCIGTLELLIRHQVSPRRLHVYGRRFCKLRLKLCNAIFMSAGFYWKENIMCIRYPVLYKIKMRQKLLKQGFIVISVEIFPFCAMKAYVVSRGTCIASLFLSLSARWRWMVSVMPRPLYPGKEPRCPLSRRVSGPHARHVASPLQRTTGWCPVQ